MRSCYGDNFKCGTVNYSLQLIYGGEFANPGQWPWTISYFIGDQYACGGSLVTNKFVITAAHCVQIESYKVSISQMRLFLGRHSLNDTREKNNVRRLVERVIVHEDFAKGVYKSDADIALLEMKKIVKFSNFIRPICLPDKSADVFNVEGTIVGYGMVDGMGNFLKVPKFANISSVGMVTCLRNHAAFIDIVSDQNFCAGRDGVTPCSGDSGGGFFYYDTSSNQWMLYGIVSRGINQNTGCNPNHFTVFVDVPKFVDWIFEKIEDESYSIEKEFKVVTGSALQLELCDDQFTSHYTGSGITGMECEVLYPGYVEINFCCVKTYPNSHNVVNIGISFLKELNDPFYMKVMASQDLNDDGNYKVLYNTGIVNVCTSMTDKNIIFEILKVAIDFKGFFHECPYFEEINVINGTVNDSFIPIGKFKVEIVIYDGQKEFLTNRMFYNKK